MASLAGEPKVCRCLVEFERCAGGFDGELAEEEVAALEFVEDEARAVTGEGIVGQDFETNGRDGGGRGVEGQVVGDALGDVAAGEDRIVGQHRQDRACCFAQLDADAATSQCTARAEASFSQASNAWARVRTAPPGNLSGRAAIELGDFGFDFLALRDSRPGSGISMLRLVGVVEERQEACNTPSA